MTTTLIFEKLGISLLLGLLVGLQRERKGSGLAGFRTFPLFTVLGTVCALVDEKLHAAEAPLEAPGLVIAAGFLGVIALVAVGRYHEMTSKQETGLGVTTEAAILLMYGVGAYVALGEMVVAIAVGGGVAVLLQFKPELHGFAKRLGDEDLRAIMQFVLITCIVLPVLPNETYGPFEVLNPFEIWLMVVLIVGISLGGYIVYKFMGPRAGIMAGGLLGGAISSTATTASYARRSQGHPERWPVEAMVIVIASSVVFVRVLVEIAIVAPNFLPQAAGPMIVMMLATLLTVVFLLFYRGREVEELPEQENPSELKSAIVFGLLYAGVLLALAAAKEYLGGRGLYLVAALSGLTDMDAITLSTARMVRTPGPAEAPTLDMAIGWRLIVTAIISNLVFKAGIVAVLGHRKLFVRVLLLFAVPAAVGVALMLFWPAPW